MAMAIIVFLLMVGSVLFHFWSPWYLTPIASNWGSIDVAVEVSFWVCGAVFIAINTFLVYSVFRYRNTRAHYEPENARLEKQLTLWTSVGVALLLAPGLYAWAQFVTVPENVSVMEAVGQQWQWSYRFPGRDGVLGTTDVEFIDNDNPFGLNPADPFGRDDVLISDSTVHIPVGKPLKVVLRSKDVLHDFFVPEFRARMNLVPGLITYFWFTPTRTGTFEILCAQLCGVGHYVMRGTVIVDDESTYETWLNTQPTFGQASASAQ